MTLLEEMFAVTAPSHFSFFNPRQRLKDFQEFSSYLFKRGIKSSLTVVDNTEKNHKDRNTVGIARELLQWAQIFSLKGEGCLVEGEGKTGEDPTEDVPTVTEPLINHLFPGDISLSNEFMQNTGEKKKILGQRVLWLSTLSSFIKN